MKAINKNRRSLSSKKFQYCRQYVDLSVISASTYGMISIIDKCMKNGLIIFHIKCISRPFKFFFYE